jgi:flagellar biosynthesis chaperone FliJ
MEALTASASKREESYIKTLVQVCTKHAKLLKETLPTTSREDLADQRGRLIDCVSAQLRRLRTRLRADAEAKREAVLKLDELQKQLGIACRSLATILEIHTDPEQSISSQIVIMATKYKGQVDRRIAELMKEIETHQSTISAIHMRIKGIFGVNANVVSVFQGLDLLQDKHEEIQKENEDLKEVRLMFRNCLMGLDPDLKEAENSQLTDHELVSRIQHLFDPDLLVPG